MFHVFRKIFLSFIVMVSGVLCVYGSRIPDFGVVFDTRNTEFKSPFGAVAEGSTVSFTIKITKGMPKEVNLIVSEEVIEGEMWVHRFVNDISYPMKRVDRTTYTVDVKFDKKMVYGYIFEIKKGRNTYYYGNNDFVYNVAHVRVRRTGGSGRMYDRKPSKGQFVQTVYDGDFRTPDWSKDMVTYYIFPERFKNGNKKNDPKPGVTKFYGAKDIEFHNDWNDRKPWVPGDGKSDDEWNNDFYGGDIEGIISKLDYIKNLGFNAIYLNPIFQAPSNHKYDTADYLKIDESFGTLDDFKRMVSESKKRGIRIMLDTSLNHSGSDSVYMDRYGKYPGIGAFENEVIREDSPYYNWYSFTPRARSADGMYKQWANPSLASFTEHDSYKEFAYRADDSVTKYWLNLGIDGWRMDVVPWKSDTFWREWSAEVKKTNPSALTIAEAWFDCSKYFLGDMFDSTMNYIFRQAVYDYAKGGSAVFFNDILEMVRENYPSEAFHSVMNLLSTHDSDRALAYFGYTDYDYPKEKYDEAVKKLKLASFIQMSYPGAPAVYYGDEAGMTGKGDPANRGPFPWEEDGGNPDRELTEYYRQIISMRNENPVLRRGSVETVYIDESVVVKLRILDDKEALVVYNNSTDDKTVTITLPQYVRTSDFKGYISKGNYKVNGKSLDISITGLSGELLTK